MEKREAEAVAAAIHCLRPDWPVKSLMTFIGQKLANRPYSDVAVALTVVACDPKSRTPTRVLESGPWWEAATPKRAGSQSTFVPEHSCPDHPQHRSWACPECAAEAVPAPPAARAALQALRTGGGTPTAAPGTGPGGRETNERGRPLPGEGSATSTPQNGAQRHAQTPA